MKLLALLLAAVLTIAPFTASAGDICPAPNPAVFVPTLSSEPNIIINTYIPTEFECLPDGTSTRIFILGTVTPDTVTRTVQNGGSFLISTSNTWVWLVQDRSTNSTAIYAMYPQALGLRPNGHKLKLIGSTGEWVAPTTTPPNGASSVMFSYDAPNIGLIVYNNTGGGKNYRNVPLN